MGKQEKDCVFCMIGSGKLKSNKVYSDSKTCAFLDINPRNPGHTLVIPKNHYETIFEMSEGEVAALFKTVRRVSIAIKRGMKADGLSIAQSNESAAGQAVTHMHVHIIPRYSPEDPVSIEGMLPVKYVSKDKIPGIISKIKKNLPK